jgi:hypothetical protein
LLAVHWSRVDAVLKQAGDLSGKVIVTCSLPMNANDTALAVAHTSSGAETLAKKIRKSMRYTDRLADAGIAPSVGSRGDSYDNALAESVIGRFKTEVQAGHLQSLLAEFAGAIGPGERCDDQIALLHRSHIGADGLDDADELVAHPVSDRAWGIELQGQRSLPQIHARVTRTRASVGSISRASGTLSTRTSCAPYITVARIESLQSSAA